MFPAGNVLGDKTDNTGNFIAWDARTGKIVWSDKEHFSVWSGTVTTAGGLAFYGTLEGYLKAVDLKTGKELYKFKTPSGIIGNVITYEHAGKQYVAVLSGIGGWAGIGLAAGLEKNKTDVSPGDGYRSLSNYTSLGGTLTVLSLQDDNSAGLGLPSRIFAGPGQYPPKQFKAYGIVAFKALYTHAERARYDMICEAYLSSLLHFTKVKAPPEMQMVTVWPVETSDLATRLNKQAREAVCGAAVEHYGLSTAQEAIEAAKRSKASLNEQGPFLLAWSPGAATGNADALVLMSDMSDVINIEQAKQVFAQWMEDIQENPELWEKGWNIEKLRLVIRLWADKWGEKLLKVVNVKEPSSKE